MSSPMDYYVKENSIVRKIWGKSDTILFIFAGSAAEFALNKAVDWLYFTGKLPSDPIGRLFSTVSYAREIVFSEKDKALQSIDKIASIHRSVEKSRGYTIPDWAYRDVLFMLIHYSIASFELLERKLSDQEKEEVYDVFYGIGTRMELKDLPATYKSWMPVRQQHLLSDLSKSDYSTDLFKQYKKHLGAFRYTVLIEAQKLVVPARVAELLNLSFIDWMAPVVPLYKASKSLKFDSLIRSILLPKAYKKQILALDVSA